MLIGHEVDQHQVLSGRLALGAGEEHERKPEQENGF